MQILSGGWGEDDRVQVSGLWGGAQAGVALYRAFAREDLLLGLLPGALRPGESGYEACYR